MDAVAAEKPSPDANSPSPDFIPLFAAGRPPASDHSAPRPPHSTSATVQHPQPWKAHRPRMPHVHHSATGSDSSTAAASMSPGSVHQIPAFELPPMEDRPSEKVLPLPDAPSATAHQEDDLEDTDRSEGELQVSPVTTALQAPKRVRQARTWDVLDRQEASLPSARQSPDWTAVLSNTAARRRRRQPDESTDSGNEISFRTSSVTFVPV